MAYSLEMTPLWLSHSSTPCTSPKAANPLTSEKQPVQTDLQWALNLNTFGEIWI